MYFTLGASGTEPITRADAKTFLRVNTSAEDALIDALIATARQEIEDLSGRFLTSPVTVTYYLETDEVGTEIWLPFPPMVSVSEVATVNSDDSNTVQTEGRAEHYYIEGTNPGRIKPGDKGFFEGADLAVQLKITFTAGYATVPPSLLEAVRLRLGERYSARQESVVGTVVGKFPQAVTDLVAPYRYGQLSTWV